MSWWWCRITGREWTAVRQKFKARNTCLAGWQAKQMKIKIKIKNSLLLRAGPRQIAESNRIITNRMTIIKRFLEWIGLKEKLHNAENVPTFFKEGEIWWCHCGENVGTEMNGKGSFFTRPVIVMKKYDRYSFLAVPLTTKEKSGTWYASFTHGVKRQTAVLSQARAISYKRLKERVGKMDSADYGNIKEAFKKLHK